jgi:hypothetical protein
VVGVLIEMRTAVTRRQTTGKRAIGTLLLVLLVTLFAVGTLLAGLKHYRYPGAGANVVATLCLGWLLGRVGGPLVTGDDAALRMDYFKLLRWLAVPVAIAWAAFLSWRCTQAAVRRLEERGPEIFAGTRTPAA